MVVRFVIDNDRILIVTTMYDTMADVVYIALVERCGLFEGVKKMYKGRLVVCDRVALLFLDWLEMDVLGGRFEREEGGRSGDVGDAGREE